MKISLIKDFRKEKPNSIEVAKISKSLNNNEMDIEFNKFCDLVSTGCTFSPFIYKNQNRNIKNSIESNLIVLDFDNQGQVLIFPQQAEEIIYKETGLKLNYAYHSFSSTEEKPKYRLIYLLDKPILSDAIVIIQEMICNIFPIKTIDGACAKDKARLYYGGKEEIKRNLEPNKSEDILVQAKSQVNITIPTGGTRIRTIKKIDPNKTVYKDITSRIYHHDLTLCKLYNNIDKIKMDYAERNILLVNSVGIKGGFKHLYNLFEDSGLYEERQLEKMILNDTYYRKREFNCVLCEDNCPYFDECDLEGATINIRTRKSVNSKIGIKSPNSEYNNNDTITLEEGEEIVKNGVKRFFENKENILLKVTPGVGKTYQTIKYITDNNITGLYTCPTHKNLDEIEAYFKSVDFTNYVRTLNMSDLFGDEKNALQRYSRYLNQGRHKAANNLIRTFNEDKFNDYKKHNNNIISNIEELAKTKMVLTTHERLLRSQPFTDINIIIDEDITKSVKDVIIIKLKTLKKALSNYHLPELNTILNISENIEIGDYKFLGSSDIQIDEDIKEEFYKNGNDNFTYDIDLILEAQCISKKIVNGEEILFLGRRKHLAPIIYNSPVLTLSATVDEAMLNAAYGKEKKIEVIEADNIKFKGELYQVSLNTSRTAMKDKNIDDVLINKVDATITYKQGKNDDNMNIDYTEGRNDYKGKDIAVIGTPQIPQDTFLMECFLMGFDIKNTHFSKQTFTWNNVVTVMATYDDPFLRMLHLNSIQEKITQAINRNRLVRFEDTKTYLYSVLPQKNVTQFIKK